jgi:hypothetical protein
VLEVKLSRVRFLFGHELLGHIRCENETQYTVPDAGGRVEAVLGQTVGL